MIYTNIINDNLGDGTKMTLEEAIKRMENAERIVKEIRKEFLGKNYKVEGWLMYGELEPIDHWFEDNDWEI